MSDAPLIPTIDQYVLALESRLVDAASSGQINKELAAEIAEVFTSDRLDLLDMLSYARALHAAGEVCALRGDEDSGLLHSMAQDLIGRAIDTLVMQIEPVPAEMVRH